MAKEIRELKAQLNKKASISKKATAPAYASIDWNPRRGGVEIKITLDFNEDFQGEDFEDMFGTDPDELTELYVDDLMDFMGKLENKHGVMNDF